jgi:methylphosphotriester-DNA--protein-cysteine methyltransferase
MARHPSAEGAFLYAIKTTGVYLRPSSPSRHPKPESVEFFDTSQPAETAGYRPGKRSAQDHTSVAALYATLVEASCRKLALAETPPSLPELASDAVMSTFYFHRVFRAVTGLRPKSYAAAYQAKRIRERLSSTSTVIEAIYDAGFSSKSRFYEASNHWLGVKPSEYRTVGQTPIKSLCVAIRKRHLCPLFDNAEWHRSVPAAYNQRTGEYALPKWRDGGVTIERWHQNVRRWQQRLSGYIARVATQSGCDVSPTRGEQWRRLTTCVTPMCSIWAEAHSGLS